MRPKFMHKNFKN